MKKMIGIVFLAVVTASLTASAAELNDPDRAELRNRAQELQNQRASNPDFQPGESRATPQPADLSDRGAKHAKPRAHAKSATKESTGQKASRSLKNIPGALLPK